MPWINPSAPNIADFLLFIGNSMQIPTSALPANSPWPQYALNRALDLVLNIPTVNALEYVIACYMCAGHILLRITPDQAGQTYFATARQSFGLLQFIPGAISTASDQGTSDSLVVPDQFKNLTVGDLNFLATPYGREYLSYAQDFGQISGLA